MASNEYDQSGTKWQSVDSVGMGNVVISNVKSIVHMALSLIILGPRARGRLKRKMNRQLESGHAGVWSPYGVYDLRC